MKRILVIGSSGFVGRNLCAALRKHTVYTVGKEPMEGNHYLADIMDRGSLSKILNETRPEEIFYLAALTTASRDYGLAEKMLDISTKPLIWIYEQLAKEKYFKRLVYLGTSEEYGPSALPYSEESAEISTSPYAWAKTAGVNFLRLVGSNESFPSVIVRPGMLFGRHQPLDKFIPYVTAGLLAGRTLDLTKCEQTRDLMPIDDFVKALLLVSKSRFKPGEVVNISSGVEIRLRDLVEHIRKRLGVPSDRVHFGAIPYRENESMRFVCSVAKLKKLGIRLTAKDIYSAIDDYTDDMVKNHGTAGNKR